MPAYQLLSCDIALGGDTLNVVVRHRFIPVTYPELLCLRYIHGEHSVTNIYDCGAREIDDTEEMNRLCVTYTAELVRERMFPGAGNRLPRGDNRYPLAAALVPPPPKPEPAPDLPPGAVDFNAAAKDPEFVPSAPPTPEVLAEAGL